MLNPAYLLHRDTIYANFEPESINGLLSQKAKIVLHTKGKTQEIPLGQELTIGRGYSNLLRLDGEEISRVHAIVYRRDNDYYIRDLDSKNGIFLNGSKVNAVKLTPGDKIQIGKFEMMFSPAESHAGPPPPPPPPPQQPVNGAVENDSGGGVHFSDDEFSKSQMFSAPTSSGRMTPPPRQVDEVLFFTREQLRESAMGADDEEHARLEAEAMRLLLTLASGDSADLEGYVSLVLTALAQAMDASRGVVVLHAPQESGFSPLAIYPNQSDVAVNRVVMREGFSQERGILCPALRDCGLFRDSTTVLRDRIATLISVPLRGPEGEAGLLYLDRQGEADGFNMAHMKTAGRVARLLELYLFDACSQATPPHEALR